MMSVGTAFAYIMGVCFLCRTEIDRVHREAARDRHHAFGSVEIAKPDPWRHRTGLTI